MDTPDTFKNDAAINIINPLKGFLPLVYSETGNGTTANEYIRFEERKELYTWVHTDDILFVKSADHYVKSLVQCGKQKKWMSRHCTLKELLVVLPADDFIRLNKFYLLNRNHFSHIDEAEKILYFKDGFSAPVPHRISPFLRRLLKAPVREMHFTK
jgi:DNA-binding LytR/AlgR family response regulator